MPQVTQKLTTMQQGSKTEDAQGCTGGENGVDVRRSLWQCTATG